MRVFAGPFKENITFAAAPTFSSGDTYLTYLLTAAGGSFNVTLPSPVIFKGCELSFKRIDATMPNAIRLLPFASEKIDTQSEFLIQPMVCLTVVSDGTNWWII
jgi:hypothetical protein